MANIASADAEIHRSLRTLRSRSRDLCMNNDYARRFLKKTSVNIVGNNGIRLQVRAESKDGVLLREANDKIQQEFNKWSKKGVSTVCGRLSWIDCQRIFIESVARDGEVLVRMIKGKEANNEWGFALQFLEADHLNEDLNQSLSNGNYIRMGIEFNRWSRPVAYHILTKHPGEELQDRVYENAYQRIKADEIIHGFILDRSSQSRGIPWMHTAMSRLKMLSGYEEAELVAARVGASKMGFFVSPDGASYTGHDMENGRPIMEADPGTFEQLPAGMDIKTFDPNHPTGSFAAFEKAILRGIASGLDISYNTLANDLEDVNFSSIRHGSLEDRDSWRALQNWLMQHFCTPIFEQWLLMSMTSGKLNLPLSQYDRFNKPVWKARGWAWVDPLKENHANQIAIKQKTKTRNQIAAEQGMDIEELFQQFAYEEQLAKEYGLNLNEIEQNLQSQKLKKDKDDEESDE